MVSMGTESVPPPIPIMELKKPIHEPIMDWPTVFGSWVISADLPVLNSMFSADKLAINPNNIVNQVPSTSVTSQLPANTPMRMNGAKRLSN